MDDNTTTANVSRAILAALDWNSSPETRKSAVAYLESVKSGDVRILAHTSFHLVKKDNSSEIRLHAFKMLQHLVRLRWDELNNAERRDFANVAVDLWTEVANPGEEWALKSQMAALVAEIVRREGAGLWNELFPTLVVISNSGPVQAELVLMVLRWLPEDITVHNEDLEGDRRRVLLRWLTESLPEVLPLLYTLLERHFGAALSEAGRGQMDVAKQHAAAVTATLNAVNAYAEWAPLVDLLKFGVIHGCGFLLSSPDFRIHACEFFKLVSSRNRPVDADSEFDSAMGNVFQILMNVSRDFLNKSGFDESEYEFVECVCESMVSLGCSNLRCVGGDDAMLLFYFQQMMGYFQHFKLGLHNQSLFFWLALLRDLLSKSKIEVDTLNLKGKILMFLNDDICGAILDVSFPRMLKKEKLHPGTIFPVGTLELWSDDMEGKGEFSQYRSRLLELIRFLASHKPIVAATKVSERITMIINGLSLVPMPSQELAVLESMQLGLENIVSAVFDDNPEIQLALCRIFEGLLQQLLSLKWTEPTLVEVLGHYLVALGPFLKYYPDAVGSVVNKLFELLNSLPFFVKDPATSTARHARLQICTSFIRIAKTSDKSLLPHMKGIADTMAYMEKDGRLLRAEHNILGEAFLVIASTAGVQQQQEVLAWLLEPLSVQWTQIEWQNAYLSDPSGVVRLCGERQFMWSLFHTVTFFEKALKRSGVRKANQTLQNDPTWHPMASHLSWMLPPLLKLLRAIHSLWSPPITQTLPGEIKAAMFMSDVERTSLFGETNPKGPKSGLTFTDASQFDMNNKDGSAESNEGDIRNWLKGIRDSGYNVLGLSTTIGDSFYKCLDIPLVNLALMENIQNMEFRHIRQLVHSVLVPLVKSCPTDLWGVWVENILQPLLVHSQLALSGSWSSFLQDGKAKVPDLHGVPAGLDLKVEVIEDKILRGLTREICSLLSVLASPGLNTGLPPLDPTGHVDLSTLKDLDAFASSSIVGFILSRKSLALPALQISLDALKWTDGESVTKVSSFCGSVILVAIFTNNIELREFVAKDMFCALIQALALESNAFVSTDLVAFCREIFIYLANRDPAPRQILLSLPCITHQDLVAFEEALAKTSSPKEQKQHLRSLLLLSTGNKLKALAAQKSGNVITNVSTRPRNLVSIPESRTDEGEPIGLAAIL